MTNKITESIDNAKPSILDVISDSIISDQELISMDLPERKYYLSPWLRDKTVSLVYSKRGVGKTWFGLSVSLAITRNVPIGKWETDNLVDVLYIDGEMSINELRERIGMLSKNLPDPVSHFKLLSADYMVGNDNLAPKISDHEWREAIYQFLKDSREYKVVILDNLSCLTPGIDENDKQSWDSVNQWLISLRFLGVAVIMFHHAGKKGDQRGTSAREDNIDIAIYLESPKGHRPEEGAVFDVQFLKTRGIKGDGVEKFRLRFEEQDGGLTWKTDVCGNDNKRMIIAMLGQGFKQKEIESTLGISKGYVSQVKKKAMSDGMLNKDNSFTDDGKRNFSSVDINIE